MKVLICKNTVTEGPGTIEDFLAGNNVPYTVVELGEGDVISRADDYDVLVMMGGPMSVNEDFKYPYIREEVRLVKDFVSQDKKVLGICLGAQIMARALGARVYVGPRQEIGWHGIELTGDGLRDRNMMNLAVHPRVRDIWKRFRVFHWHGETFDIPSGGVRLASSDLYLNQAFRFGKAIYALQFHIEVRKEMIYDWLRNEPDFQGIKKDTDAFFDEYSGRAENFYRGFFYN